MITDLRKILRSRRSCTTSHTIQTEVDYPDARNSTDIQPRHFTQGALHPGKFHREITSRRVGYGYR